MSTTRDRTRRDRALYVEIRIRAPLDTVWRLTQDPDLHARWDARFSSITPVRVRNDGAQEFRYERSLGPATIRGTGVSLGERRGSSGGRTSALVFDADDAWSPLARGRGYWRYVPTDDGVRFVTGYDYAPGWGWLGRVADPLVTRRFVWWLTAHSFDRLRLWAESGVEPERTTFWRGLLPGRRPRARASRCLRRPQGRGGARIGVMGDAPAGLARIGGGSHERDGE